MSRVEFLGVFFPLDSRFSLLFWKPYYFYLTLMCLCALLYHNTNYNQKKRKKKENESLINYFILTFEAESSKDTKKGSVKGFADWSRCCFYVKRFFMLYARQQKAL